MREGRNDERPQQNHGEIVEKATHQSHNSWPSLESNEVSPMNDITTPLFSQRESGREQLDKHSKIPGSDRKGNANQQEDAKGKEADAARSGKGQIRSNTKAKVGKRNQRIEPLEPRSNLERDRRTGVYWGQ
ncbi:hypothetical protein K438DRAFT_1764163 [Mycena galopus ATCC 62051]|nr:hypothetical protein K438DRAFT_1764163 [Mycena galopus ATCC 62051]